MDSFEVCSHATSAWPFACGWLVPLPVYALAVDGWCHNVDNSKQQSVVLFKCFFKFAKRCEHGTFFFVRGLVAWAGFQALRLGRNHIQLRSGIYCDVVTFDRILYAILKFLRIV